MPPRSATALLQEAQELLNANDLAGAKERYERVLRLDSSAALAYVGLGQIAFQRNFLDDAAALFEEAYDIALEERGGELPSKLAWTPRNEPLLRAMHGRGLVSYRRGDTRDARTWFEQLLQLNAKDEQGVRYFLDAMDAGTSWARMSGDGAPSA